MEPPKMVSMVEELIITGYQHAESSEGFSSYSLRTPEHVMKEGLGVILV